LTFEAPSITSRDAQPYVAIVTAVTMEGFDVVDGLTDEVFAWLEQHGVAPSGSPLQRIVTSDMTGELDIEVGVPVNEPPPGDDRFVIRTIPAGSYVTLVYAAAGDDDHLQANIKLQAWAADQGLEWDIDSSSGVDVWVGRYEFFRTDLSSEGALVFELTYKITDGSVRSTMHE
jgi:effector-binding domain-containing protein